MSAVELCFQSAQSSVSWRWCRVAHTFHQHIHVHGEKLLSLTSPSLLLLQYLFLCVSLLNFLYVFFELYLLTVPTMGIPSADTDLGSRARALRGRTLDHLSRSVGLMSSLMLSETYSKGSINT